MRYILHIILLLSLLTAGCSGNLSSDDSAMPAVHEVEVTFNINAKAEGDLPESDVSSMIFVPDGSLIPRQVPPREVMSSNNWQQVNDVRIYVFRKDDEGNFIYYKPVSGTGTSFDYVTVDDFSRKFIQSPFAVWWGGSEDLNESHSYVGKMQLESGEYVFLAVARDDKDADTFLLSDPNVTGPGLQWQEWTAGKTRLDEALMYGPDDKVTATTELFSGYTGQPVTVDGSVSHFACQIMLRRAVAGILLYVENIPATMNAYDPDEEIPTGIIPEKHAYRVVSLAVIHGEKISDRVLVSGREAVEGTLDVPEYNSQFNPPTPGHVLLKIDIPEYATVRDGLYENTSPDNIRHPNSLCKGAFAMPQLANGSGTGNEDYSKSLYLVFYGYDESYGREFALGWVPVRLAAGEGYDCDYYPVLANHFYSIGRRCFSPDGSILPDGDDVPMDLKDGTEADIVIKLDPFWNEYYGGEIGDAGPGLGLDPEWGEHPGGYLQQ